MIVQQDSSEFRVQLLQIQQTELQEKCDNQDITDLLAQNIKFLDL